jgi:hypothetical protein
VQIQKLSNCKDGMLKLFSDCLEFYFSPKIRVLIQLDMGYVLLCELLRFEAARPVVGSGANRCASVTAGSGSERSKD